VLSADVPEESSRRSVQQLENSVGRAQFWCEEPACCGVQQNGGVPDQRCQKPLAWHKPVVPQKSNHWRLHRSIDRVPSLLWKWNSANRVKAAESKFTDTWICCKTQALTCLELISKRKRHETFKKHYTFHISTRTRRCHRC